MNIKKMFTALSAMVVAVTMTLPSASVFGAEYSQELQDAYNWAHEKGVTTMSSIENANMYGAITRAEMAKMLSVYATEVLKNTPDTSKACTFTDIDSVKGDLHDFIIESCQLGIMGQGITAFRPYDTISRAEFGTALSRVLWGDKYEGGTPYYANHLNALKAAAIMNQIANAESTKEIRGYVMLMLMRSEDNASVDCTDADIMLACLDPEAELYKECPAACREDDSKADTNVKSGDLALTAAPEEGKKVISDGYTSYLDTLTLKASEDVTVNSITLERYGYSTTEDVESIWLEDSAGNVISSEKGLSASKDSVTLSLKKDYRTFSDKDEIIIVVKTAELNGGYISGSTTKVGTNIGFKVTAVDSSAKNLNLDDYSAYLYDIINYDGSEITVELKGKDKTYNVSPDESYEVAKIKVAATNSAIDVDGFTLTNASGLDISDNIEKVEVKVDGNAVKGLDYTAKKDTLKINFNKETIGIKKSSLFTVYVTLKEDFEDYGDSIAFYLEKTADLKAFEAKTSTTVKYSSSSNYGEDDAWVYTFAGGKVTFTNTKLASSIDAAAGSEGVVIAQGTVKLGGEPINIKSLTITPSVSGKNAKDIVDSIKIFIDDDEAGEADSNWKIKDILIEKDATIKVVVDLEDDNNNNFAGDTISFQVGSSTAISSKNLGSVEYDNSGEPVDPSNIAGSISLSKIKVNESKASLKNSSTKAAEFVQGQTTSNKTLFDGTYTAKKSDIYLNEVALIYGNASGFAATDDVTITIEIDGTPVATMDASDLLPSTKTPANLDDADYVDFSDIKVKAGESVKVKVIANVYDDEEAANLASQRLKLVLRGDDDNGTAAGRADANTVELKITVSESVKVTDTIAKKTVVLKDADVELARFVVKPSNNSDEVDLTKLVLNFENFSGADDLNENNIDITIDNDPVSFETSDFDGTKLTLNDISYSVPSEGVEVVVTYNNELAASQSETKPYKVTLVEANSSKPGTEFTRYVVPALITLSQADMKGSTKFTVDLELDEEDATVTGLVLKFDDNTTGGIADVSDGSTIELNGSSSAARFLTEISYYVGGVQIVIKKSEYNDYFVYGDTYLKIFKAD